MTAFTVKRNAALTGLVLCAVLAGCEKEVILPGERFDTRTPLEASIPTESNPRPTDPASLRQNASQPISLPPVTANAEWTQRGGVTSHLAPHGQLSAAPVKAWSTKIGAGDSRRNRISAAPVVGGGRIFTVDAKSTLQATSTGGQSLWSVNLAPPNDRSSSLSGGGLSYGGGRIYATTGYGELIALDAASGGVLWRQELGAPATGAPTVDGDLVYVVGRDSSAWAVETRNGRVRWQIPGTPSVAGMIGGSAPAIAGSSVLFPFASGEVMAALREGGVRLWSTTVAGNRLGRAYTIVGDVTGDPVVAGPVTYVGTAAGKTDAFATASGELIWSADEGALGPVVVAGGSVFLISDEARLVRLDAGTGEPIWATDMPYFTKDAPKRRKAIYAHYGPILAGGRLAVASSDGVLRFFSPVNGALVGSVEIPGGAASQPALAGGTLYVVSGNGQLHAFR